MFLIYMNCTVFRLTGITRYGLWGARDVAIQYVSSNAAIILSTGFQLSNLIIAGCGIERIVECGNVDYVGEQAGVSTRGEPG